MKKPQVMKNKAVKPIGDEEQDENKMKTRRK